MRPFSLTLETPVGKSCSRSFLSVSPEEPATALRRLFRERRARLALVVDRDGRMLGVVDRGDILVISSRKSNARARDLMHDPLVVLEPNYTIEKALTLMLRSDEWYAPVIEAGRPTCIFGLENAIQRMLDEDPDYLRGIPAEDVMSRDVETASPDDYVAHVWEKMRELRYAGLPVVDEKGRLVGIITQHDLLASGAVIARETTGGPARGSKIREVMTRSVEYIGPRDPVFRAAALMVERGFGRVPVADAKTKKLLGIIDREDIVRIALGR